VQVDADVPPEERMMLLGLQAAVRPVEGDTEAERETVPAKPFTLASWTVTVEVEPVLKLAEELLVVIVKSGEPGGGGGGTLLSFQAVRG
jgi:hypothetical protein